MERMELQQIMQQHGDYLLRLSYVYVKDWATAEDIVQDVFVKFYSKPNTYEARASLKTYLAKMTIHKSCDYLRSFKNRLAIIQRYIKPENEKPTDAIMLRKFAQNEIAQAVFELPIKYREVIIFYFYEEMTTREIGMLLNLPEGTIKSRLLRAKQQLKIKLSAYQGEVNFNE